MSIVGSGEGTVHHKEKQMGWDIRVWHEENEDRARLVIEAGTTVPEEVISAIAGSYWLEEVQFEPDEWDDAPWDEGPSEPGAPPSGMHG